MVIPAQGFFHKCLRDAKVFRQIPQLGVTTGDSLRQCIGWNKLFNGPLIRTVLILLAQIQLGIAVVE